MCYDGGYVCLGCRDWPGRGVWSGGRMKGGERGGGRVAGRGEGEPWQAGGRMVGVEGS